MRAHPDKTSHKKTQKPAKKYSELYKLKFDKNIYFHNGIKNLVGTKVYAYHSIGYPSKFASNIKSF